MSVSFYPGGLLGLADQLPGENSGGSRLEVFSQAWELVQDFPLTGGGLASFAGLYSRYALMIPHFVFDYSHHFLLDVLLEQGLFGGLALSLIYLSSFWRLLRFKSPAEETSKHCWELMRAATLTAFVVVGLHGLMDDALYGGRGTPLVLLLPGLSLALTPDGAINGRAWLKVQAGAAALVLAGLAGFFLFARAHVYANLGAVAMARVELAGFPEANWNQAHALADFQNARAFFDQARQLDPNNRTAAHRLGLLAFQAGDYEQAATALAIAGGPAPSRGLAKPLGYSYTWLGELERAGPLLLQVTEARYELDLYSSWWPTQNRPDLAERSAEMEQWLAQAGAPFESNPLGPP
jgi:tetratricopeptide (TPR) repeat protein